jgi:hypothetical protein|tara:strand:+ start:439 stop:639 length:201 start_codon:yes stop_codon:yes gene_type:complete
MFLNHRTKILITEIQHGLCDEPTPLYSTASFPQEVEAEAAAEVEAAEVEEVWEVVPHRPVLCKGFS